jgi:hypothetical protein
MLVHLSKSCTCSSMGMHGDLHTQIIVVNTRACIIVSSSKWLLWSWPEATSQITPQTPEQGILFKYRQRVLTSEKVPAPWKIVLGNCISTSFFGREANTRHYEHKCLARRWYLCCICHEMAAYLPSGSQVAQDVQMVMMFVSSKPQSASSNMICRIQNAPIGVIPWHCFPSIMQRKEVGPYTPGSVKEVGPYSPGSVKE